MANFAYISGDPDNLTGGAAANMVDIQGPFVDLEAWLNNDLQPRVAAAVPSFVTSLPSSATDGQEIYFRADDTNGVIWHLRYRAASASSYKWEFVGGSSLSSEVVTDQGTASTTYVDLTTVGPSVTVPLAGEYNVAFGAHSYNGSIATDSVAPTLGGAASDNDASQVDLAAANKLAPHVRRIPVKGLSAATVVKLQYRVSAGTGQFRNRWLEVRPVRVG